jgi:hypothetical protein
MKKPELCNIIIQDGIQNFNKTNKNDKYINKLKRDHKKLLLIMKKF